jgi:hypothetical protein
LSDPHRLDVGGLPPFLFVIVAMQLAVVDAAEGHSEFVANLAPKRPRLPKLDVMRIGRTPAADKARLRTDEFSMRLVAFPNEFRKWRWRFGFHNCNPLGDTRGRPILGG